MIAAGEGFTTHAPPESDILSRPVLDNKHHKRRRRGERRWHRQSHGAALPSGASMIVQLAYRYTYLPLAAGCRSK